MGSIVILNGKITTQHSQGMYKTYGLNFFMKKLHTHCMFSTSINYNFQLYDSLFMYGNFSKNSFNHRIYTDSGLFQRNGEGWKKKK